MHDRSLRVERYTGIETESLIAANHTPHLFAPIFINPTLVLAACRTDLPVLN
jgi:hypothetical protein